MVVDTKPPEEASAVVESVETAPDEQDDAAPESESADVAALRAELERAERRLQEVVDRYETLLAQRSRAARGEESVWTDGGESEFVWQGDEDDGGSGSGGWLARLRSLL